MLHFCHFVPHSLPLHSYYVQPIPSHYSVYHSPLTTPYLSLLAMPYLSPITTPYLSPFNTSYLSPLTTPYLSLSLVPTSPLSLLPTSPLTLLPTSPLSLQTAEQPMCPVSVISNTYIAPVSNAQVINRWWPRSDQIHPQNISRLLSSAHLFLHLAM